MSQPLTPETTAKAQHLLAAIPAATSEVYIVGKDSKPDARWAACRARMISNLLELTGRMNMVSAAYTITSGQSLTLFSSQQRYSDRGEISLVDDTTRAKHVQTLAFESFISVLG
jgi:nuclear pore complex protein Nup98-Nup96